MNWTEYYMRHQYLASEKSKDPSTKIGAVLVRGDNIVSIGYEFESINLIAMNIFVSVLIV